MLVMAGLVPAIPIHLIGGAFPSEIAGTSPAMTVTNIVATMKSLLDQIDVENRQFENI